MPTTGSDETHVFISYSHCDQHWLERLQKHLKPLGRDYKIICWDDTRLTPGRHWRKDLEQALERADIAILLISADFLASQFIVDNELPPLLDASEDRVTIIPVIVNHSFFLKTPSLAKFQAVNSPQYPLAAMSVAEQEALWLKVAETVLEKAKPGAKTEVVRTDAGSTDAGSTDAGPTDAAGTEAASTGASSAEAFLEKRTWLRLVKIGGWIFDEEQKRIIGTGPRTYLLSRGEYGSTEFEIHATLQFSNMQAPKPVKPGGMRLGMNAGIVFGWKSEDVHRYKNILLTGAEVLLETIGDKGGQEVQDFQHLTKPEPLRIDNNTPYKFHLRVTSDNVLVSVNDKPVLSAPRPPGIVGRVGIRPWRSQIECKQFVVQPSVSK